MPGLSIGEKAWADGGPQRKDVQVPGAQGGSERGIHPVAGEQVGGAAGAHLSLRKNAEGGGRCRYWRGNALKVWSRLTARGGVAGERKA